MQNNKGQLLIKDEKGKNHFINEKLVKAWQDEFKLANAQDDFLPEFSPQIKDILAKNGVDEIHLKIGSLIKLNARDRGEFIKHIKPTLQEPDFILKDESGVLFVKNIGKDKAIFASIAKNENGEWVISTNSYKRIKTLKDRIESNDTTILYQSKEASNQLVEAFTNTPFRAELDNVNSSENLGKSQATNEQEPKILSEMQRIQKLVLMKDLPEPTPAQQKKINTLKSMLEKRQNELKEVQDKIDKIPNAFSRFNSNNTKRAREKSLHNKKKALNLKIQDIKEQLAEIDNTMPKNERYFIDKGEEWNNSIKAGLRDLEPISDYELAKKSLLNYENVIKGREWAEFYYNTQPLKEFGTNYAEFYRDGQGAVKKLLAEKQGQVAGAFYRQDLGDIDLIWGKSSGANDKGAYGLAHIIDKHGDEFAKFGSETRDEQISNALN